MTPIEYEKYVIEKMVGLYCKKIHKTKGSCCEECDSLIVYAHKRLDGCRYGDRKPSCKQCKTHCYSEDKKAQIRTVMRFAAPRSLLYFPLDLIKHVVR